MPTAKPEHRWYQFSLLELFWLTTILAVALSIARIGDEDILVFLLILTVATGPFVVLFVLCSLRTLSGKRVVVASSIVLLFLLALLVGLAATPRGGVMEALGGIVCLLSCTLTWWALQCFFFWCMQKIDKSSNAACCRRRRQLLPDNIPVIQEPEND